MITQIYHELRAMKASGTLAANARVLQEYMDGASENLNLTMLSFYAMLVEKKWFDVIYINRFVMRIPLCCVSTNRFIF